MTIRRILIVYESGLLAQGLVSLLQTDERVEVVKLVPGVGCLTGLIREISPDAVVIEGDKFPLSLGDPPDAVRLEGVPLVIVLAENENRMRVYRVEEKIVTEPNGLIDMLTQE